MVFRCDECKKEGTGLGLLPGWLEVRFFNQKVNRDYFYHFCGYGHLTAWSEKRELYYKYAEAEEAGHVNKQDKGL
jgi:hypothetical protein